MRRIYFDNAATTPLSKEVIKAMLSVMENQFGNPSSIHAQGRTMRATIEEARKSIARYLNASIGEIFFTSGGTESNNMALKCAVRDLGITRFITSPIEHHCVLHTLENLKHSQGIQIELVNIDDRGRINYDHLEELLEASQAKTMVSLMHANNEVGTLLDLERVSKLCLKHEALLHSDTVQSMAHYPYNLATTRINFMAGGAHKFHGPKGTGFIYINADTPIKPLIDGGAQERNMRGGTENVYGIVGMAKAFILAHEQMSSRRNQIESLRQYMMKQLQENFEDICFNGDFDGQSLYTVLSVSFPPSPKAELMLLNLDIAGISASGGSACSSGAEGSSHVMSALKADPKRKTIRFSFSHYNTKEEIDFVIEKLKTIVLAKEKVSIK